MAENKLTFEEYRNSRKRKFANFDECKNPSCSGFNQGSVCLDLHVGGSPKVLLDELRSVCCFRNSCKEDSCDYIPCCLYWKMVVSEQHQRECLHNYKKRANERKKIMNQEVASMKERLDIMQLKADNSKYSQAVKEEFSTYLSGLTTIHSDFVSKLSKYEEAMTCVHPFDNVENWKNDALKKITDLTEKITSLEETISKRNDLMKKSIEIAEHMKKEVEGDQ